MPEGTVDDYTLSHLAYVGLAVNSWADLEFEIDFTIWDLMDCPQALSACLTAQLVSPIPKLKVLLSLVRLYEFEQGITPPRGGAWSNKTVLRMMQRLGLKG